MNTLNHTIRNKHHLRIFAVIVATLVLGGITYAVYKNNLYQKESVPTAVDFSELNKSSLSAETVGTIDSSGEVKGEKIAKDAVPPTELNLKLTFYSQAPFGDWGMPWQEACEEASMLLVANEYFDHNWTREEFRDQILKVVDWEMENYGQYEHTNVEEMVDMLDKIFGLQAVVHENPSMEDIKAVIARGNLIIAPFGGKLLGNPNYTNGGPMYHVMVIKGYKEGPKIITNDVGTRKGEDYVYTWDRASKALHDYADPIENGPKRIIEVVRPEK